MLNTFFESLDTAVNRFWRWFYIQEKKLFSTWSYLALKQKAISWALIWIALNGFLIQGLYSNYRTKILSFQVTPTTLEASYRTSLPTKLIVNSVAIELPIIQASIADGVWQTSQEATTHLSSSARPGERSNMVIYGHNKQSLLSPLHQAKVGEEIAVETDSGVRHTYLITSIQTVGPKDIQYVLPTSEEQLTLYTCTGFLDSQRLVIIANPNLVNSI